MTHHFIISVRAQAEAEVFKMVASGKRKKKAWKRMVMTHTMTHKLMTHSRLQKYVMFQMILLEKCQNMKDLFDQWQ